MDSPAGTVTATDPGLARKFDRVGADEVNLTTVDHEFIAEDTISTRRKDAATVAIEQAGSQREVVTDPEDTTVHGSRA